MNVQPKRSKSDLLLNLMVMAGMMLLLCTIPEVILLSLQAHYQMHLEWQDAVYSGGIMMGLMAVTGIALYWLGLSLLKRRRNAEDIVINPISR